MAIIIHVHVVADSSVAVTLGGGSIKQMVLVTIIIFQHMVNVPCMYIVYCIYMYYNQAVHVHVHVQLHV